ncbi:metallophosphoesterase family protein [Alienimonas chondri]|uniref:Serine/threonine-protein phosphatase 1 n=1 Tax=Alienimonas chondri TaxID=2681879 RepID=A0ABX1VF58_9PLAN|nr:metallophosphoesterase family protein [Alienimonas chondri]NNJ25681.1 Serine/threonine-protein phosphatase 1 [Alienimonas chondri]
MPGRHLAIGDIHGCLTAFETLLALVAPQPGDVVVALGDYVDRGPNSRGVLDRLIRFEQDVPGVSLVSLRGNHEIMLCDARDGVAERRRWLDCGGDATLGSYAPLGQGASIDHIPVDHWTFLDEWLSAYHETDDHIFVHANLYPDVPLEEQPDFMLYWELWEEAPPPHESGKRMICGHTRQRSGLPRVTPYAVCIDTGACRDGWLTCLCAETGELWQANERGETRTLWLDEV